MTNKYKYLHLTLAQPRGSTGVHKTHLIMILYQIHCFMDCFSRNFFF